LQVKKETGDPILVIETSYPTGPRILELEAGRQIRYVRAGCEEAFTYDAITSLGWFRFSGRYENHSLLRETAPVAYEGRKTKIRVE